MTETLDLTDESLLLKDISINLNGEKIVKEQIYSLTIDYSITSPCITGRLVILDPADFGDSTPFTGSDYLALIATDKEEVDLDETFKVYANSESIIRTGEGEMKTLVIDFIDPVTYEMIKLYPVFGSEEEISIDGILDSITELQMVFREKSKDFDTSEVVFKNFVVPLDRPFINTFNYLLKRSSMLFYQTRTDYRLKQLKNLFKNKTSEKFVTKSINPYLKGLIQNLKLLSPDNMDTLLNTPDATVFEYDFQDITKSSKEVLIKDINEELFPGKGYETDFTGTKHYSRRVNGEDLIKSDYYYTTFDNQEVEIYVAGSFDYNVGDVVELDFSKLQTDKLNKLLSGDYLIKSIQDVITANLAFTQRIILCRPVNKG